MSFGSPKMVSKNIFVCLNDFLLYSEILSKVSKEQKTFKKFPMKTKKDSWKSPLFLKDLPKVCYKKTYRTLVNYILNIFLSKQIFLLASYNDFESYLYLSMSPQRSLIDSIFLTRHPKDWSPSNSLQNSSIERGSKKERKDDFQKASYGKNIPKNPLWVGDLQRDTYRWNILKWNSVDQWPSKGFLWGFKLSLMGHYQRIRLCRDEYNNDEYIIIVCGWNTFERTSMDGRL